MNFTITTTDAYAYRPLKQGLEGWDVYALQTGLNYYGDLLLLEDGVFGADTHVKVKRFQKNRGLIVDGIAGILTQRAVAMGIATAQRDEFNLPVGLLKGQIESESAFILGNHSPQREDNSRDVGVVQRNDHFTDWVDGFHTLRSIEVLSTRIATKYVQYRALGKVSNQRCWELAAGSWNAPAWTDTLARGGTLKPEQLEHIEAYISRVTSYVTTWPVN